VLNFGYSRAFTFKNILNASKLGGAQILVKQQNIAMVGLLLKTSLSGLSSKQTQESGSVVWLFKQLQSETGLVIIVWKANGKEWTRVCKQVFSQYSLYCQERKTNHSHFKELTLYLFSSACPDRHATYLDDGFNQ